MELGRRVIRKNNCEIKIGNLLSPFYEEIIQFPNREFKALQLEFISKQDDQIIYWFGKINNHLNPYLDIEINFEFNNSTNRRQNKLMKTYINISSKESINNKQLFHELKINNIYISNIYPNIFYHHDLVNNSITEFTMMKIEFEIIVSGRIYFD